MNNYRGSCPLVLMLLSVLSLSVSAQSTATYLIKGEIRNSSGQPMSGASVCATPKQPGGRRVLGTADADGRFNIPVTNPGDYTVNHASIPYRGSGVYYPFDEYPAFGAQEVSLGRANPEAYVSIVMPEKNGTLEVKIADSSTHFPVELISIQMCQSDKPGCTGPIARSETGVYRLYPPPVPFVLRIMSQDYQPWNKVLGRNTVIKPGSTRDLTIEMRRRPEAVGKALTDGEKQPGFCLPAPVQSGPAENERFNHYPRSTVLNWDKVEGAVSYGVEVDYCQAPSAGNECLRPAPQVFPSLQGAKPITDTSYKFDFIGAQPGRWRVWAIDKDGRAGFKSPWRMFSYSH